MCFATPLNFRHLVWYDFEKTTLFFIMSVQYLYYSFISLSITELAGFWPVGCKQLMSRSQMQFLGNPKKSTDS